MEQENSCGNFDPIRVDYSISNLFDEEKSDIASADRACSTDVEAAYRRMKDE